MDSSLFLTKDRPEAFYWKLQALIGLLEDVFFRGLTKTGHHLLSGNSRGMPHAMFLELTPYSCVGDVACDRDVCFALRDALTMHAHLVPGGAPIPLGVVSCEITNGRCVLLLLPRAREALLPAGGLRPVHVHGISVEIGRARTFIHITHAIHA